MIMRKNLFLVAFLMTTLVACKNKSAFNYSQNIVAIEKTLEPEMEKAQTKLEEFFGAEQFDSAAAISDRMEKLVQQKVEEVSALKLPKAKEAESFRSAAIKYFKYIKSLYTAYRAVGEEKDPDQRQEKAVVVEDLFGQRMDAVKDMQDAQLKYARANGFKVEN
jgi:hypothetical protein